MALPHSTSDGSNDSLAIFDALSAQTAAHLPPSPPARDPSARCTIGCLSLADIIRDPAFQVRFGLDESNIQRLMDGGREDLDILDPVEVYDTPDGLYLAHGFHRVAAAERLGLTKIRCLVRLGSKDDALICAYTANAKNGLPLRGEEKREAARKLYRLVYKGGTGRGARWRPGWSVERVAQEIGYSVIGLKQVLARSESVLNNTENPAEPDDDRTRKIDAQLRAWKRLEKLLADYPALFEAIRLGAITKASEANSVLSLHDNDRDAVIAALVANPDLDVGEEVKKIREIS
jgi:hypothetical protein